jgi:HK97 family phage prohead protease
MPPYEIVPDHAECDPGNFAVVDKETDEVEGCYPTELDAQDAMKALTDGEPSANDGEHPRADSEPDAIIPAEVAGAAPTLALIRGGGNPRAARALKTGREARSGSLEIREAADGSSAEVFGYASRTGTPYTVTDMFGEYSETIDRGAFERTIREQDVRLYVNHDGMALARSSVNLTLAEDDQGLAYSAQVDPSVTVVGDLVKLMRAGIMRESSFAFQPVKQEWNADYTDRHISEVKLFDVSVVSLPASPTTSAGVRSALLEALERQEPVELDIALRYALLSTELREGKVLSSSNAKIVREAIDALTALLDAADGGSRDAAGMMIETALVEVTRRRR